MFSKLAAVLVALTTGTACTSTQILKDKDYQSSLNAFRQGNPEKALEVFPRKEQGGFITTVEKGWLGFWNGKPEIEALRKQSRTFDDRKFVSITREAKIFLTQESEEGYVPSEHEVVVMHLVSAMNHMALEKWEEAEVEAKRAAFYLQNPFNENQPHFDDPALRVWLATIWSALGRWDAAQVDLRRAATLSHDFRLKELAEKREPEKMAITFEGVGPDLAWKNSSPMPECRAPNRAPTEPSLTFPTLSWCEHHRERNTVLRDTLVKSNYMAQYVGIETLDTASRGVGSAGAITLGVVGVTTGVAIVAGGLYALAGTTVSGEALGYILMAGGGLASYSYKGAKEMYKDVHRTADEEEKRMIEDIRTYRLVRFMPNWISLKVGETGTAGRSLRAPSSKTSATFIHAY